MKNYQHILLAVDLHSHCDNSTVERALEIAKDFNAKITLLHVVEHINTYGVAQAYPAVMELEERLLQTSKEQLIALGTKLGIPAERQVLMVGSPKAIILQQAQELNADLIVVGSHGRHGLALLLGSTANAVLHHAPCDVLAVRVPEHNK